MATLHFFAGKAGAGKTTRARLMGQQAQAVVICEDEWISRLADPIVSLDDYLRAAMRVRSILTPNVTDVLRLGVSVVFDFGGNTAHDRAWVKSVADAARAGHVLHYLRTDDSTCRIRVHLRNETRPEGVYFGPVSDRQLDEVNAHFVPPGTDEGLIVVEYDGSADR